MPKDVFYFDHPGPRNYRAPWLSFSDDLLCPEPQRGKPAQVTRRKIGALEIPDSVELPRKRQRPKYRSEPYVISLLSSDEERDSGPLQASDSRRERHQKKVYQKRVSIEDVNKGLIAAKCLSRAATIPAPQKEVEEIERPALTEITAKQPPGIKRFGTYTNSFELNDRELLVQMGFISPKRPRFSDPTTLKDLVHDTADWIMPHHASPKPLDPSSIPPSSFIPLDSD